MHIQAKNLARRRQELIARCAQQRASFVMQRHGLKQVFSVANVGLSFVARVKKNLGLIVGLAVALAVIRPRRLSSWLQTAGLGLKVWRIASPVLRGIGVRRG